jgi:hypothetical protein
MGERSIQWDMSRLFPGLQLRIGPSVTGGLMEFVMDPHSQYDERSHINFESESTGETSKQIINPKNFCSQVLTETRIEKVLLFTSVGLRAKLRFPPS